jgi:hypothetical protein
VHTHTHVYTRTRVQRGRERERERRRRRRRNRHRRTLYASPMSFFSRKRYMAALCPTIVHPNTLEPIRPSEYIL